MTTEDQDRVEELEEYRDALLQSRVVAARDGVSTVTVRDKTMGRYTLADLDDALGRVRSELGQIARVKANKNPLVYSVKTTYGT